MRVFILYMYMYLNSGIRYTNIVSELHYTYTYISATPNFEIEGACCFCLDRKQGSKLVTMSFNNRNVGEVANGFGASCVQSIGGVPVSTSMYVGK